MKQLIQSFKTEELELFQISIYGGKKYIEAFSNCVNITMNDFREMYIYSGGKDEKVKSTNQDKGLVNKFKTFRAAVKSGKTVISFESIHNTTKTIFKILESIRSGNV